jgi:hypothetical protein
MQWFQYLIAPLIAGVVAALASTYLTARFSFNRFRQEQWWQAKRDAYESIIRALSEIMFSASRELAEMAGANPPKAPERQKELSWSLQEIASSGAYIVSEKTVAAIAAFRNKSYDKYANDSYGMIDEEYGAAKAALEIIRAEAHRDLGVEG